MHDKYILDGKVAKPATDLLTWGEWFEKADRRVAFDKVGDVEVSTVFLGLDHSFGDGPPLLFETMIFNGTHDNHQTRATTWEEAEQQHLAALLLLRLSKKEEKQNEHD